MNKVSYSNEHSLNSREKVLPWWNTAKLRGASWVFLHLRPHRLCLCGTGWTSVRHVQCQCSGKLVKVSEPEVFMGCWSHRHILLLNQPWKLKLGAPTAKIGMLYQAWCLRKAAWQAGTEWSINPDGNNKIINHQAKETPHPKGHIPRGWPRVSHSSRFAWKQ